MDRVGKTVRWKKLTALASIFLILGILVFKWPPAAAAAGEDDSSVPAYNIILLVDKSGSMNTTDPPRLALDAAKMFVHSFYAENMLKQADGQKRLSSRVGVISFSGSATSVIYPEELSSQQEVSKVVDAIDTIAYDEVNTGATDLGRAVQAATDLLQKTEDADRKNVVILFTDGYTEFPYYDTEKREQKLEESGNMMKQALQAAKQTGCEIFVVGLNYNDSIRAGGLQEILDIANSTQTGSGLIEPAAADTAATSKVNYAITSTIPEVQHFYKQLFAYLMNAVPPIPVDPVIENGWSYYDILIDTPGVFALNIYVTSPKELTGKITLREPNGNFRDLSDIPRGQSYSLMTILRPEQGIWRVGAEGKVSYNVAYVPISTTYLQMEASVSGAHGNLAVQACYDGTVMDEAYYANDAITFTGTVMEENSGEKLDINLSYSEAKNALVSEFTVPKPGTYKVEVAMTSANMEHSVSQNLKFVLEADVKPLSVELMQNTMKELDVSKQLSGDGWDSMTLAIKRVEYSPEGLLEITNTPEIITIKGIQRGEGNFTIYAMDSFGQSWEIPGTVHVTWNATLYIPYFLGAALLLTVTAFLLWRRLRYLPGKFTVTCEADDGGYFSQSSPGPRGTSFSLYALLQYMGMDKDDLNEAKVIEAVEKCRGRLTRSDYRICLVKKRHEATYRYKEDKAALAGKIFEDDDTGLRVKVRFQPAGNSEKSL